MDIKEQILTAFNFRHACKEFDPVRKISDEDFNVILEVGRLSPSSFGLEPWKFVIVQNVELREKISPVCWGGQKQLATASHYLILLARSGDDMRYNSDYITSIMSDLQKSPPDILLSRQKRLKQFQEQDFHIEDDLALFNWACRQVYIVLGNMMTTAAMMGIDSCPIEGFDLEKVEDILSKEGVLEKKHFGVACMVVFGYRVSDPKRMKTRHPLNEVVSRAD